MARTKKLISKEPLEDEPSPQDSEQSPINTVDDEKHKQQIADANLEGQQEIYTMYANFLKTRMMEHFEHKHDDLAKEIRDIYLLTIKNVT